MGNHNCYIEFEIFSDKYFIDLKRTFDLIKEAKNSGRPQSDEFWVSNFPEYSLKQFFFAESDKKPYFQTAQQSEFIWHFYSLTSLLQSDYDIEYVDCFKLSETCGRIEYAPFGYPYGGITGLIVFISSFKCRPTIINDGTSVYQITFKENGDFAITDLKDPERQNSSVKQFGGVDLLRKYWNRLK